MLRNSGFKTTRGKGRLQEGRHCSNPKDDDCGEGSLTRQEKEKEDEGECGAQDAQGHQEEGQVREVPNEDLRLF